MTPKRYWIRLTAEFDDGATYHVQREVTRAEVHASENDVIGLEFNRLRDMLDVGLAKQGRG